MKTSRLIVLTGSLLVATAGHGARADQSPGAVQNTAVQNLASWNIAFNEGGLDLIDEITTLYTDDAVLVTPSGRAETSSEGIRDFWQVLYEIGFNTHALDVTAVQGNGNQIIVTSNWEALRSPQNDTVFEGRMTTVLEQQADGRYKTSYQSWH